MLRIVAFALVALAVMASPASAVKFERYYRVTGVGLPPLSVTSTGFTDSDVCVTVVNGATQPVIELTVGAYVDDMRVKPASHDIKRRIDPGMSSKENCVAVGLSDETNVVVARVEKVVLADGTVVAAQPFELPRPAFAPGTMTAADGTTTVAPIPIDLTICQAALGQYDLKSIFTGLEITYKNVGSAAIQHVDFQLTLPSGVHTFSDVGAFDPGQTITHRLKPTPPIGDSEVRSAIIPCNLTKIQFVDGRVWTPAP